MSNAIRHRTRALNLEPKPRPQGERRGYRGYSSNANDQLRVLRASESQQMVDPFAEHMSSLSDLSGLSIIEPPYNFSALLRLPRDNNMLRQCIDAMVTNVEGHGWRLEYVGPDGQEASSQALAEQVILENLLNFPNLDHSLQELRARVRRDLEVLGNAYVEVGRDRQGRVVMTAHVPAHTIRLTNKESDRVEVVVTMPREGQGDQQRARKAFRRYVQIVGPARTFFKEFGDPRTINPANGRVEDGLGVEESATELIHLKLYDPGTPYGIPRWINQLPAILGSRQAELTNLDFFNENAIPAMALLVSGGVVTQSTIDEVEEQFHAARGRASFNRILIIEARGDEEAASQDGTVPVPRMELKPLQSERQRDALFQVYDANNMTKIRSSFRLPPIFVGLSQDYTHATARTSFDVAESQVFGPERGTGDDVWNTNILSSYSPKFWSFRSLPPKIVNPTDIVDAIDTFESVGALTPNVAIGLANDLFDLEIAAVEAPWGDFPFSTVEALLAQGVIPDGFESLFSSLGLGLSPEDEDASQESVSDEDQEGEEDEVAQARVRAREALKRLRELTNKGVHLGPKRKPRKPRKRQKQKIQEAPRYRSRGVSDA